MKPKILFIGPSLAMGGMERSSVNTANGLSEAVNIIFVSVLKKSHFFKLSPNVHLEEPKGINENKLSIIKTVFWIRRLIKLHKPDRVIVFNKLYGALAALALAGQPIPFYISERSSPLYKWKLPIRIIHRIAYSINPPSGVIAQTSLAAEHQKRYFPKSKVAVIPNALREITTYPQNRKEIILAVGRLGDYLKGFDLLIESFALLKNKNWILHIVGGDGNSQLKKKAKELNVLERIFFLGKTKDIDKEYAKAGIFVIPSRSEGFPNALIEAMANGCPCISFDFIAGPRDIIENGHSGIIVQNGNIFELAKAIDYLIINHKIRHKIGNNAIKIKEKLNHKIITNRILEFIDIKYEQN